MIKPMNSQFVVVVVAAMWNALVAMMISMIIVDMILLINREIHSTVLRHPSFDLEDSPRKG